MAVVKTIGIVEAVFPSHVSTDLPGYSIVIGHLQ